MRRALAAFLAALERLVTRRALPAAFEPFRILRGSVLLAVLRVVRVFFRPRLWA
jgi:hypothetical protein